MLPIYVVLAMSYIQLDSETEEYDAHVCGKVDKAGNRTTGDATRNMWHTYAPTDA
jgi:hypothetical protein